MSRTAYILHGYGATPADHWFPWLAAQLEATGIAARVISLPDSRRPDFARWQQALADSIGMPQADDWFIAHSLGTISLLHYLSHVRPARIGGVLLVAGFAARLPALPYIEDFHLDAYVDQARPDFPALRAMSTHMASLISDNDGIVAPQASHALAQALGSDVIVIPGGAHFCMQEGFTQLPAAWDILQSWGKVS